MMDLRRSKSSMYQSLSTQESDVTTLSLKKADQYILPKCKEHPQQTLQRICTKQDCPSFFTPTCMDCLEQGHDHNIKGLQNIKPILVKFTDQIMEFERTEYLKSHENDELHYNLYKGVIKMSKQYKDLSDLCYQVSTDLSQQAEDLMKVITGEQTVLKSKEFLSDIFNSSASALKLTKNLKFLKKYLNSNSKNKQDILLDINQPGNSQKQIDFESTIADIRYFLSSKYRKINETLQQVLDQNLEELIVYKNTDQEKIPLQGCVKCKVRCEEKNLAKSEVCGHFYCKKCLSSFKDIFLKSKNIPFIKCLGHLNKVCNKQLSRKQWEQLMGMNNQIIIKHSQTMSYF